jgi:intracellular sulfur oxidation DsrE/DsrF family protein
MNKLIFILFLCFFIGNLETFGQQRKFPLIKSGGAIFEVPEASPVVDKKMKYKIIVDLSKGSDRPDSVNSSIDKLARLVNSHIEEGVPKENLSVVAVFHFLGTTNILTDEAYQKKFGMKNPNALLINELAKNGVQFYVCGQSLRARKLSNEPRNENIKVAQSALITFATFQNKGYALILP